MITYSIKDIALVERRKSRHGHTARDRLPNLAWQSRTVTLGQEIYIPSPFPPRQTKRRIAGFPTGKIHTASRLIASPIASSLAIIKDQGHWVVL